jgi:hypothetical protein
VIEHRARTARIRSPRIAVTAVFVAHGLLFASWTAHIPHVMRHLGLTDGTLGIALLGARASSSSELASLRWYPPCSAPLAALRDCTPGTAVATVWACGWTGFVCGPPLIGHLASIGSLPLALGLLPFLTAFVAVGALVSRALRDAPPGPASPARSEATP